MRWDKITRNREPDLNIMKSPSYLLKKSNIHPKKQLGQNFLINSAIVEMIISRSNVSTADIVLEIGAGLGAMTIPLARSAKKVYAVETDRRILPLLKNELISNHIDNVDLLEQNILNVDIQQISAKENSQILAIGNLPYNISSQILIKIIDLRSVVKRAVFMLQKELVQRIKSNPNSRDYGRLSVILQYCADIKTVSVIKANQFYPKPKVDSEVIELNFKKNIEYLANDEKLFLSVIKAAFSKRRKTLKNSLSRSELHTDVKTILQILDSAQIDPQRRAETLTVEEFVRLSNCFSDLGFGRQ